MAQNDFVLRALLDYQNVKQNVDAIKSELTSLGKISSLTSFEKTEQDLAGARAELQKLNRQMETLNRLRSQLEASGQKQLRGIAPGDREAVALGQGPGGQGRSATLEQLSTAAQNVGNEIERLNAFVEVGEAAVVSYARGAVSAFEEVTAATQRQSAAIIEANRLVEGGALKDVQLGLARAIDAEISKLQGQISDINASVAGQDTEKQTAAYERIPKLIREAEAAETRALQLTLRKVAIEEKIAGSKGEQNKEALEQLKILDRQRSVEEEIARAARRKAAEPQRQQDVRNRLAGTDEIIADLDSRLSALFNQRDSTFDPKLLERQFPELESQRREIENIRDALVKVNKESEEYLRLVTELEKRTAKLKRETERVAEGGGLAAQANTAQEQNRALAKLQPGIDRLFNGIFSDMARRFVATLQFTISAAIIFGAQRLAREFIDAAIKAQRAFADISTALDFDISAERGTLEFRRQVEAIRQDVLLLANDLNILPSEASEAAFVMVARFQDVGNAMIALRAQLLAVKVSGIDQNEVLRALTAAAEGFASSVLEANNSLTIQERLLRRETQAVENYGKALDLAVFIQQRYGVETEDVLEGTARATEVFRQLGFSMEETAAIVTGTSRQLGQTGQQVAERLNRSLGQITDPKIREALLELAAVNDNFSLSLTDFESGASAWKAIVDQFERLERIDPQAARQILQIVGQRRELEAVAAALGTADLQEAIVRSADQAAGAAENRFNGLRNTIDEILKSIAANFQSLAQTFSELGGLQTLELLLVILDKLLGALNNLLLFTKSVIQFFDAFTGGAASAIVKAGFLAVSIAGVTRAVIALRRAYEKLAQIEALQALATFFTLGGSGTGLGIKAGFAAGGIRGGVAAAGAAGLRAAQGLQAAGTAAIATVPVWGLVAAGVLAAGFAIKTMIDKSNALAEALDNSRTALARSSIEARRSSLEENLSPEETRIRVLEAEVETLKNLIASSPSGEPGVVEFLSGNALFLDPSNIEGSSEFFRKKYQEKLGELITADISQFRDDIAEARNNLDLDDLDRDTRKRIEATQKTIDNLVLRSTVSNALASGGSDKSAEERQRLYDDAADALDEAALLQDGLLRKYGALAESTNDSAALINKQLAQLSTKISLNLTTPGKAAVEADAAAKELRRLAETETISGTPEYEQRLREAEDAQLQAIEFRQEQTRRDIAAATQFRDGRNAIVAKIRVLSAALHSVALGTPEWDAYFIQLSEAYGEFADATEKEVLAALDFNIAISKNFEERTQAIQDKIDDLLERAKRARGDSDFNDVADNYVRQAQALQRQLDEELFNNETKLLVATKRLSGPILNPIIKLQSDLIDAQRVLASQYSSLADKRQAEVRIQEILAALQRQELERLRALALSNVSVRDSFGALQVELEFLTQSMVIAGEQYGESSKAYLDAVRAVEEARARIIDAVLQLESINRQLDPNFDVTDPLARAEENWIRIMRQLQIPDLGELERASLELEAANAEAALVRAQYNDELFRLQFLHESGKLGTGAYVEALRAMLAEVDTTTHQGKEIWLQINSLIESLTNDIAGQAFNIPGQIRIPTLFEVRRAVQAEALGVNYQDNRTQQVEVYVSDDISLQAVLDAIADGFDVQSAAFAPGGAGITIGGFS